MISQQELLEKYAPVLRSHGREYLKVKGVFARPANAGEEIITITNAGVETKNTASEGDYIIKNETAAGEEYILKKETFHSRYDHLKEDFYIPNSSTRIFALQLTKENILSLKLHAFDTLLNQKGSVLIEAPWQMGERLRLNDYLAVLHSFNEVYGIAAFEFNETYRKIY